MNGEENSMGCGQWVILQMAGPRTLKVVKSLGSAGVDAWTPAAMERRCRPRSRKYRDVEVPLLPSFAFARLEHLEELLEITHAPVSDHPPFSILQRNGTTLLAGDADLDALRQYEVRMREQWESHIEAIKRDAKRKHKKDTARAYVLGQRVKVEKEAFSGLVGKIVEIRKNGDLALEFTGFLRGAVVPSCDVQPVHLSGGQSEQTEAA